jgi:aspartyl/asparaginyl beta-hydroxylase (cupin superfamily)
MTLAQPNHAGADMLWFSSFGGRYTGPEPGWFDSASYPWVEILESHWTTMRDEVVRLTEAQDDRLGAYFNHAMVFPPKSWKTLGLYFWSWHIHRNLKACPRTVGILSRIPDLLSASLSVLEPGSNINPHQGDTNAVIRVHLPLIVPGGLPDCGFQVGDEARPWREGEAMLFLDAKTHFAWNRTDRRRYVLILDVLRPQYSERRAFVCSNVLASIFMQGLCQRVTVLNRMPGAVRLALHRIAQVTIRAWLPLQRRLGR